MQQGYWDEFMERTGIPQEARAFLWQARSTIFARDEQRKAFEEQVIAFTGEPHTRSPEVLQNAGEMAQRLGHHAYTFHFLLLVHASEILRRQYAFIGIAEDVFWDTMGDLQYKLMECWNLYGIWGTCDGWWYKIFFSADIFMLGRLQYERVLYPKREGYSRGDVHVRWGDPVLSIHIPSSGPLDHALCLDSYRKAHAFFERRKGPLICICHSWLLFPGHEEFLPERSNILQFMRDFDIIEADVYEAPHGNTRIFGARAKDTPETWPEDTGLRRAYKARILTGGTTGAGFGVMVFDGNKIIRL